jgi:hypothetical protein
MSNRRSDTNAGSNPMMEGAGLESAVFFLAGMKMRGRVSFGDYAIDFASFSAAVKDARLMG